MRFEELSDNIYQKNTDSVERYLLSLVQEFMSDQSTPNPMSREYVIRQAVARAKEEINFDGMGVTSVQLPGDENPRTGAVSISLEELGGEPRIDVKRSAFNVDFGMEINTACEGNDPRLSDARIPLPHAHEISDIQGLEGLLSTYKTSADYSQEYSHNHDNQAILDKLIYSGTKLTIDLAVYEQWEQTLYQTLQEINNKITQYKQEVEADINQYNTNVNEKYQEILEMINGLISNNEVYLQQAKDYCDTSITNTTNTLTELLADYITKNEAEALVAQIKDIYVPLTTIQINLPDLISSSQKVQETFEVEAEFPASVSQTLSEHLVYEGEETVTSIYSILENDSFVDAVIISDGNRNFGDLITYDNSGNITAIVHFGYHPSSSKPLKISVYNPNRNLPNIVYNSYIKVTLHVKLRYIS